MCKMPWKGKTTGTRRIQEEDEVEEQARVKQVELKEVLVQAQAIIGSHGVELPGFKSEIFLDQIVNQLVMKIRTHIWGEDQEKIVREYSWPSSWWQHFKRDVLGIRKVLMTRVTVEVDPKVLYPRLRISLPGEEHMLRMIVREDEEGTWLRQL